MFSRWISRAIRSCQQLISLSPTINSPIFYPALLVLHGGPIKNKSTRSQHEGAPFLPASGRTQNYEICCVNYIILKSPCADPCRRDQNIHNFAQKGNYLSVHRILLFGLAPVAFVCTKNKPPLPAADQHSDNHHPYIFVSRQCERRWLYFCSVLGEIKHDKLSLLRIFRFALCAFHLSTPKVVILVKTFHSFVFLIYFSVATIATHSDLK